MVSEVEVITHEVKEEVITDEMVSEVVITDEIVSEVEVITGEVGAIMDDIVEFVGNNNSVATPGGVFRISLFDSFGTSTNNPTYN